MSAIATLRKAVAIVLTEAEARVINILETTNDAVTEFVSAVFHAGSAAVQQVVDTAFSLAGIVVNEAFNVADAVATAALGDAPDDLGLSNLTSGYTEKEEK